MLYDDLITSVPVSLSPFVESSDGTRLNMASNHMRQSLEILANERPMVITGLEDYYRDMSCLSVKAPCEGVVLYVSDKLIVIKMDIPMFDTDMEVIDISRKKYNVLCHPGDRVTTGDIICEEMNENGSRKEILNGANLLTAIGPYYGFNYQDGVVISESCAEKLGHVSYHDMTVNVRKNAILLSLDDKQYKPFLKVGDTVSKGDVIGITKRMPVKNLSVLYEKPKKVYSEYTGTIVGVDIMADTIYEGAKEYYGEVISAIDRNMANLELMQKEILHAYNQYSEEPMAVLPDYVRTKIEAVSGFRKNRKFFAKRSYTGMKVIYRIKCIEPVSIGDKMANRYGNKGVITIVVPDDRMLRVNGRTVDIVINIMGLVSRMNLQPHVSELWASAIVSRVKDMCKLLVIQKKEDDALKLIKHFYYEIDNSSDKSLYKSMDFTIGIRKLIDNLAFVAPPFNGADIYLMEKLLDEYGLSDVQKVYDPSFGGNIMMSTGMMFWQKLHHLSAEKLLARSVGSYSPKTGQPMKRSDNKGQRLGEMEVWALQEHDSETALKEFLTIKSDDLKGKAKVMKDIIYGKEAHMPETSETRSSVLFRKTLNAAGLDIIEDDDNQDNQDGKP